MSKWAWLAAAPELEDEEDGGVRKAAVHDVSRA